eukprot:GHVS01084215.1.p1 GENE.GHVS01084215.1~~GHVS01084215.1.p1  ORF type:complete len:175 (+),score=16.77 GHVS01084215.1:271-795(+)
MDASEEAREEGEAVTSVAVAAERRRYCSESRTQLNVTRHHRVGWSEKVWDGSEGSRSPPQEERCRQFNDRLTSLRWGCNRFRLNRTSFLDALSDASLECSGGETAARRYCLMVVAALYLFASLYMMVFSKLLPRTGVFFLDAIKEDWYYSIWLPFLLPTTVLFLYWTKELVGLP